MGKGRREGGREGEGERKIPLINRQYHFLQLPSCADNTSQKVLPKEPSVHWHTAVHSLELSSRVPSALFTLNTGAGVVWASEGSSV